MNILNKSKENLLRWLIEKMLDKLTEEQMKEAADKLLDIVEDFIDESDNDWDDLLKPVIDKLREAFGIEDGAD